MESQDKPGVSPGGLVKPSPLILLVRHAITRLNEEGRIRAWADIDIDMEKGRQATMETARKLTNSNASEIICSDLTRAEQTAAIIARQLFVEVVPNRNLRPWDLGKFMGLKYDDVKGELTNYVENPRKIVPGGESFNDFIARWKQGLRDLVTAVQKSPTKVIIAVTHSRNVEATHWILSGDHDTASLVKAQTVPPSGYMGLQIKEGRLSILPFSNDHLAKDDR